MHLMPIGSQCGSLWRHIYVIRLTNYGMFVLRPCVYRYWIHFRWIEVHWLFILENESSTSFFHLDFRFRLFIFLCICGVWSTILLFVLFYKKLLYTSIESCTHVFSTSGLQSACAWTICNKSFKHHDILLILFWKDTELISVINTFPSELTGFLEL